MGTQMPEKYQAALDQFVSKLKGRLADMIAAENSEETSGRAKRPLTYASG